MSEQEFKPSPSNNKPLIIALVVLALCVVAGGWFYHSMRTREQVRVVREKGERESCEIHLQAIALAWRIFADVHDQQFPFALSEKQGGTLEQCQRRADGVDENALAHYLMIASNNSPNIKPRCASLPPADWRTNDNPDALYHLHTARKTDRSEGILMYCPIHHLMVTATGDIVYMGAQEADLERDAVRAEAQAEEALAAKAKEAAEEKKRDAEASARKAARDEEDEQARKLAEALSDIKDGGRTWTFQTGKTRQAKFVELRGEVVYLDFGQGLDADNNPRTDVHPVAITNLAAFDQAVARKAGGK